MPDNPWKSAEIANFRSKIRLKPEKSDTPWKNSVLCVGAKCSRVARSDPIMFCRSLEHSARFTSCFCQGIQNFFSPAKILTTSCKATTSGFVLFTCYRTEFGNVSWPLSEIVDRTFFSALIFSNFFFSIWIEDQILRFLASLLFRYRWKIRKKISKSNFWWPFSTLTDPKIFITRKKSALGAPLIRFFSDIEKVMRPKTLEFGPLSISREKSLKKLKLKKKFCRRFPKILQGVY